MVVIWPASMNGFAGISPAETWPSECAMSLTLSAMCRVPGAVAGGLAHGTGPLSAQSTLIVEGSSWKDFMPRRTRSGTSAGESRSSYSRGATTVATTARAARKVCAVGGVHRAGAAAGGADVLDR